MPRFVILQHDDSRGTHWDFMLETGAVLRTWALPQRPEPDVEIPCTSLPDHRPAFLDYEGPISGDRGWVTRWDHGTYRVEREDPQHLAVDLAGTHLSGRATLTRLADRPGQWQFVFRERPIE